MSEKPKVGARFPSISGIGANGTESFAPPDGAWHLVIVWRGAHCPRCATYLEKLATLLPAFADIGVSVTGLTSDPRDRAQAFLDKIGIDLPYRAEVTPDNFRSLGVYISDPRDASETDRQFPEPGLFLINPDGLIQVANISNSPAFRPDLDVVLAGTKFVMDRNAPIRGLA